MAVADAKVGATTLPEHHAGPGREHHLHHDRAYTITQADVDAGAVANTATATGRTPAGAADRPRRPRPPRRRPPPAATLTLVKTAGPPTDVNGNGRVDAGDTIAYTLRWSPTPARSR